MPDSHPRHHPPHSLRHSHRHPPPPLLLPHPYHHGNHPPPPPGQGFPTHHPHPHHGPRFHHPPPLYCLPQQNIHRHPHQHQHQHHQQNLQDSRLRDPPVRYPGESYHHQQQHHYRHRHPHPHQQPPPPLLAPHSPHSYRPHSQPGAKFTGQGNPHARGIHPPQQQQHALSSPPPPPPQPLLSPSHRPPPPSPLLHPPPPYTSHPHLPPTHQSSGDVPCSVEASGPPGRDSQGVAGVSSHSCPAEQQGFAPGTLESPPPPHPSQRQSASAPTPTPHHHHQHTHLTFQQPDPSRNPEEAPSSPPLAKPDPQKDVSPSSSPVKTSRSVSGDQVPCVGEALKRVSLQDRRESEPASSFPSPSHSASAQPASKRRKGEEEEEEEEDRGVVGRQKSQEEHKQRDKELCEKEMQEGTMKVFPNLLNTTLHFPPQHFNNMAVKADKARGDLLVQVSGSSDMGCDRAEQAVRRCLEVIRDLTGEVMCTFFNYSFDNYLQKKDPLPSQNGKGVQLTRQVSPPSRAGVELDTSMDEVTMAGSCQGASSTVLKEAAASQTTYAKCSSKQRRRRKTSPDSDLDKPTVSTEEELESALSHEFEHPESEPGQDSQPQQASATTSSPHCGKASKKKNFPKKSKNKKKKPPGESDPQKPSLTPKSLFLSPGDLDKELQRGDFDVLVVSCRYGCLLLEIKGVGYNQEVEGAVLEKKALQAMEQLNKQEKVLRFLFQDLVEDLPVRKGLALPNVQRQQLRQLCVQEPHFAQTLCSCCGTGNTEDALATVLCADDIPTPLPPHPLPSPPPHAPSNQALLQWWHHVTKGNHSGNCGGPDTGEEGRKDVLEKSVYQGIISRLAGPYSRVTVEKTRRAAEARTMAECIHLTGLKYGRTMLREDQLHLLDCPEAFVYLTGPPGSGKTLLLGIKGLQWARQGDHVVVLVRRGVGWGSLVSLTLYQRIKHYAKQTPHPHRNHHQDPSETPNPKHKDTGNGAPSSEQTTLADNTLTENDSSSERCPSPNETQPGKLEQHLQQTASAQAASDDLQNVHTATVEKLEDTERFVQELLRRYSDRPLRILVDEGPTKVSVNYLHKLLRDGLESLQQGVLRVRSLLERGGREEESGERGEGGGGGVSRGDDLDLEARSSGWLFSLSSASPASVSKVKWLVDKVEHHLQTIQERMQVFQPPHGRPPQTAQWSDFMSGIRTSHSHLVTFIHDLQGLLTTLMRPPGDSESPTELGSDVSKLSEDVLTRSREVLQNQESNRDTCHPGPGDVNASSPAKDVAAKSSSATEDDVSETDKDDLNSPGSTLNSPKSTEGVSSMQKPQVEDLPRRCVPIGKETNPTTESCVRSCPESSQTTQLSSEQTGELPSVPAPESSVPQTSPSARAANNDAADREDSSPDSCQHQNHLQDERDRQLRGTDKANDPHTATEGDPPGVVGRGVGEVSGVEEVVRVGVGEVPGVDEVGKGVVGEVPGVEEVVTMLDHLEADMLESSGKLFNVENQLDSVAISDVLSFLVKHKDRQELSVWSSGVTPFFQPPGFKLKRLQYCLRCPPTVQHVLSLVEKDLNDCPDYNYTTGSLQDEKYPLPTNGPPVHLLSHAGHVSKVKDILDCWECGHALADYLMDSLRLGQTGSVNVEDVAISGSLEISRVHNRPCLMALTDRGIQLQLQSHDLTSPPPYPGHVFIIGGCAFQGLESKVVVFIPDVSRISHDPSDVKEFRPELPPWLRDMGRWNRCHLWYVASRCLSQLVVFHV